VASAFAAFFCVRSLIVLLISCCYDPNLSAQMTHLVREHRYLRLSTCLCRFATKLESRLVRSIVDSCGALASPPDGV